MEALGFDSHTIPVQTLHISHDLNFLLHFSVNKVQWGWGITGQKITVLGYEEFFELCSLFIYKAVLS